jgi:hypothetical protein
MSIASFRTLTSQWSWNSDNEGVSVDS